MIICDEFLEFRTIAFSSVDQGLSTAYNVGRVRNESSNTVCSFCIF